MLKKGTPPRGRIILFDNHVTLLRTAWAKRRAVFHLLLLRRRTNTSPN